MQRVSVCLVFFILVFSNILTAKVIHADEHYTFPEASEGQLNEALSRLVPLRFLPNNPLYILIIIKENINRLLQPSSSKRAEFDLVLSGKRIKEAYLLLQNSDIDGSSRALVRYSGRLNSTVKQLNKARSQNQDVSILVDKMASGLRDHETLISAIDVEGKKRQDTDNFEIKFKDAVLKFTWTVMIIDGIVPGLKDRFETVTSGLEKDIASPSPSAEEQDFKSSSPSVRPRRIIF